MCQSHSNQSAHTKFLLAESHSFYFPFQFSISLIATRFLTSNSLPSVLSSAHNLPRVYASFTSLSLTTKPSKSSRPSVALQTISPSLTQKRLTPKNEKRLNFSRVFFAPENDSNYKSSQQPSFY